MRFATPFAAGAISQPEPDVTVLADRTPMAKHPDTAVLLIEVSFASLLQVGGVTVVLADLLR